MSENEISQKIIRAALDIHRVLGPGLLEPAYQAVLAYELSIDGLDVKTQVPIPLIYKEVRQEVGYKIDLLVEDKVIVGIKALERLAPVHFAQTLTYLRLSDKKLGLLINLNNKLLKEGLHRIVNNL